VNKPLVHPDVMETDLRRLACAVFVQAVRDAHDGDEINALDAVLWLLSFDARVWLDAAGMGWSDPVGLVTSGRAREGVRRKGRPKLN
jgi:hypothetical protein